MWISPDSIKQRFAGPEYSGVTTAALGVGQVGETLVSEALSRVIRTVRGYVGKKNVLGEGETIPDELEDATLALLVIQILTRIPGLKSLLTEERIAAKNDAMKLLRDVAAGDFVIVPPADIAPTAEQPANKATIKMVRRNPKQYSRNKLSGLM